MSEFKKHLLTSLKTDDSFSAKEQTRLKNTFTNLSEDKKEIINNLFKQIFGTSLGCILKGKNSQKNAINSLRTHQTPSKEIIQDSFKSLSTDDQGIVDDCFISLCGWSLTTLLTEGIDQ